MLTSYIYPRIRTDACKLDLKLSTDQSRACIDAFVHLASNMIGQRAFEVYVRNALTSFLRISQFRT
jgi:hypothetical protein